MTDTPHEMPDAPWWSQPGTTAVLPQETPPPPPPPPAPATQPPAARKRPGTAALLALALLAGGVAGGGVATALDDGGKTGSPSVLSATRVVGSASDTVKGTPEAAAAAIAPSVVTVEVTGQVANQFGGASSQSDTGSGIVIRDGGYIVTNNHVVSAAVGGGTVHVTLSDGRTLPATIVGTDPTTDLAVIRVQGVSGLKVAEFADSEAIKVGQAVLAVGAPLGLSNTVTQGIISTLHRPVRTGEAGASSQAVLDAVQTDAAINPGNSGGALVDLAGRVIGVNSAIATAGDGSSGNIGVGFAIPSSVVTKTADQLIANGKAVHSQIGVSVGDAPNSTDGAPGLGAAIRSVNGGSPAAAAGLQPGDVVTKVGDRRVTDADSLIVAIRSQDPGTKVALTFTRDGQERTTSVTLGSSG